LSFIFLYIYSVFKKYILLNDIKKSTFWSIIAGVSFAATVYIRVSTIYLSLIFPIVIFSIKILPIRYKIVFLLLFYLSLFVSITPYSAYMYQRYGTFRLTMVDDYNFLYNNIGHALGGRTKRNDPRPISIMRQLEQELHNRLLAAGLDPVHSNPFDRSPYFRDIAMEYIHKYPTQMLKGILQGMARFWYWPDRIWEVAEEVLPNRFPLRMGVIYILKLYAIGYLLVWLGLLVGGLVIAFRGHKDWFWIFLIVALYFTLTTGSAGNDRYRMQVTPFASPLVGAGYLFWVSRGAQRVNRRA
jgi:hypothetical protein